ncbi:MAG: nucleotide exchange factor GrpE [Bacilli bacterium]|nr:nucleotide exchange factor GrpE [Bacilli bacterium]
MDEAKLAKKQAKKENKLSESLKAEVDKLNETIRKLNSDVDHWKNCYYKAYADTENLRKSIEKDHHEAIKYRAEGFVNNLLNVLDGFHLALGAEAKSEELKNYLVGFTYIYNNLKKVLEDEGVKEIEPKIGDDFDERTMEAMETVYQENEKPNKVVKVNLKGYALKEHLVRPAMVVVSTNTKPSETKKEEIPKDAN